MSDGIQSGGPGNFEPRATARAALRNGTAKILREMLPSAWSRDGRGWQELWPKASQAGFYASCDGLIALAAATPYVQVDLTAAKRSVFDHHLARFASSTIRAPTPEARRQRRIALTTTMKLAKFLQAYGAIGRPIAHSALAAQIAGLLLDRTRRFHSPWSYTLAAPGFSILASTEALIGLEAAGQSNKMTAQRVRRHLAAIDWKSHVRHASTARDAALWLWAVSRLALVPEYVAPKTVLACLDALLQHDELFQYAHWYDRFVNTVAGTHDYYSVNITLLLIDALLGLVHTRVCDPMFIGIAAPVMSDVSTAMISDGIFAPTGTTYFWEDAAALLLLCKYLATLGEHAMHMRSGMFVAPRYFSPTRFSYDGKLVTVLMPFKPEWAADVWAAFNAVAKARRLRTWRADNTYGADVIVQSVWQKINQSRLVIADCTGRNPNVFYELGIAHTVGKSVFICAQTRQDIPFDLAAIRSVTYRPTPSGIASLKNALDRFIDEEVKKL